MSDGRSRRAGTPDPGLNWDRDGREWPNSDASRFLEADGLRWHVQVAGRGPVLLLLHGTGASTHSWRALLPRLTERFTVVAPDLPGHGFTGTPAAPRMSLPGMAGSVRALLDTLAMRPSTVVGHSAGAAILAEMCLDAMIDPAGLISLNGAMLPIGGLAGQIFSPLAKLMASGPTLARMFSWWAGDDAVVDRLIGQTGSRIDRVGLSLYRRLARDPRHTAGALAMMANWDLSRLARRLPHLSTPLLLVVGSRDRSIRPSDAQRIRVLVPGAQIVSLKGLGHLAHEERPDEVAGLIERQARSWSVLDVESPERPSPRAGVSC